MPEKNDKTEMTPTEILMKIGKIMPIYFEDVNKIIYGTKEAPKTMFMHMKSGKIFVITATEYEV